MWLAEQGRLGQVAERLGMHPQTVRYRLGRLRELFGDALEDPDEPFLARAGAAGGQGLDASPGDQGPALRAFDPRLTVWD